MAALLVRRRPDARSSGGFRRPCGRDRAHQISPGPAFNHRQAPGPLSCL